MGIIYIQWNWITTMVENKEEELKHKLVDVTSDVAGELIEYKKTAISGSQLLRTPQGFGFRAISAGTHETAVDIPAV